MLNGLPNVYFGNKINSLHRNNIMKQLNVLTRQRNKQAVITKVTLKFLTVI